MIENTVNAIVKTRLQCIFLWPNIDAGANFISKKLRSIQQKLNNDLKLNFYKNFKNDDYYRLIKNSCCLVGNSSSGIRESSYLGVPVVNIGSRQNNRERGNNVFDVKNDSNQIYKGILAQSKKKFKIQNIYGYGNSCDKIINILVSKKLDINKKFFNIKIK